MRKTWRTPRVERPNFAKEHREVCPATRFFDQLSFIGDEVVGCFSFVVPVTDEGRPHHMGMWGGSSLIQGSDAHAYLESWKKFDAICRDYHVDGEISAHTSYDMGILRLQLVRQIVDGVPNPFVLGEEGYHYYHRRFYHMAEQVLRTEK